MDEKKECKDASLCSLKEAIFSNLSSWQKGILIAAAGFLLASMMTLAVQKLNSYFNLPDDNPAEELIEKAYEAATGKDVDFTPKTPEKK